MTMENCAKKLFLVDGMALLFRSFYAMHRAGLTSPDGTPVGAVYGFLKIIVKVLKEQKPSHFAVTWDPGGPNFRHEIFPDYKANRKETPEEIRPQIPLIQQLLRDLGVPSYCVQGFEGDDVVGTIAKQFAADGGDVFILSSDKDFMQLVDDHIRMFSLKTGDNYEILGRQHVVDYFGVPPEQVIDVLALKGDSVDNVPGVQGIGDKKAASLVQEFGNVDAIYERLNEITDKKKKTALENGRESALLSRRLVIIRTDVPVEFRESDARYSIEKLAASPILRERLQALRMNTILRTILESESSAALAAHQTPKAQQTQQPGLMTSLFGEPVAENSHQEKPSVSGASWGRRNYKTVLTMADLESLCDRIRTTQNPFSFDTETTGLDPVLDKPIGASFAFEEGEAFYVPAHEVHTAGLSGVVAEFRPAEVWGKLWHAFVNRKALAVAHNLKFDLHQLSNVGVQLGDAPIACSMVAAWLCDPVSGGLGLDPQSLKLLGLEKIPTSALIGKSAGRQSMLEVPLSVIAEYAAEDADATLRIWNVLSKRLSEVGLSEIFFDLEMPVLRLLAAMERRGVHVNASYLNGLSKEIKENLMQLETRIFEKAGMQFNIASPKQLGNVMFEVVKVHEACGYKGKLAKTSLGYKTDSSVLEQFAENEFVSLIIDYRELSKLLNTYIDVLPQLVKSATGRIHTEFNQTGTATGRLSSSGPNLQNIPVRTSYGKRVRRAFTAAAGENVITCADYSQIELRVLAHLAKDQGMIGAFARGEDIHRETAAKIHGKTLAEVTAEERSAAKAINFGIIYGMGAQRLAKEQDITLSQAKMFIEKYFENFPGIRKFMDAERDFAHRNGFVKTLYGRIRPIPELKSPNVGVARLAENIAINSPVQGTAADIMKRGMLNVEKALREAKLKTQILLQVHDEIVLEGPKSEAEVVKNLVKVALESAAVLDAPLVAEVGQSENWLEAK
jgi:DNA polymerase-1